jgi:transcriptional regulator with XRE-family HTH domain
MSGPLLWVLDMSFSERVAQLRKAKGWTQQTLAEQVGVRVLQIRRYENGSSQPTLEVIKKMAVALGVTADELIFENDERGPTGV